MGIKGTDVSKEASDMVLEDDNYATLVNAIKGGRQIYDNVTKYVRLMLSANFDEFLLITASITLGLPLPLLPIHVLWINLVTDGAPAVALGYEDAEKNIMNRPPFRPEDGIFSKGIGRQILMMGALIGLISIAIGFWFWQVDPDSHAWQTMIFTTLTFCQMTYALCVRKNYQSLFTNSLFSNKAMLLAVGLTFMLQLMLIYTPFLNTIFRTVPLSGFELGVCLIASIIVIFITEIEKLILGREREVAPSIS